MHALLLLQRAFLTHWAVCVLVAETMIFRLCCERNWSENKNKFFKVQQKNLFFIFLGDLDFFLLFFLSSPIPFLLQSFFLSTDFLSFFMTEKVQRSKNTNKLFVNSLRKKSTSLKTPCFFFFLSNLMFFQCLIDLNRCLKFANERFQSKCFSQ